MTKKPELAPASSPSGQKGVRNDMKLIPLEDKRIEEKPALLIRPRSDEIAFAFSRDMPCDDLGYQNSAIPRLDAAIRSIATVDDLLSAAVHASNTLTGQTIWYRGIADVNHKLVPSARRGYTKEAERGMAFSFMMRAQSRRSECPPLTEQAAWLTLMQHYGLPTRLLDWSQSILVALYFAVEKHDDRDGVLWALAPGILNYAAMTKHAIPSLQHPQAAAIVSDAFAEGQSPTIDCLACHSPEVDLRMLVQRGAYTLHADDRPLDSLVTSDSYLVRFVVPASSKATFRSILGLFGITHGGLFPDLANLAAELKGNS